MDDKLLQAMMRAVLDDITADADFSGAGGDASLGSLAVKMGCLTQVQLEACLAEREKEASKGPPSSLMEIMLRLKFISSRDLMWVLCRQQESGGLKPEMIGRYLILGELGRGAGGVVYRALHRDLDKQIALKVMVEHPELPPGLLDRFRREARIAGNLRHPNIVGVHDVGSEGERHYIAMDLIEGPTLGRWIGRRADHSIRDEVAVLAKVAVALDYAHRKGVVHRDLKPANILLDGQDEPHITDFGLARTLPGVVDMTQSESVMGTPLYMAPEQVRGVTREIDGRTDVYALGVILYEMLAGKLPFQGATCGAVYDGILHSEPAPPSAMRPGVSPALEIICLKAMAKEKGRRYETAQALTDDLRCFLKGEPILARPPSLAERVGRALRRRAAFVAAALLALIVGTAVYLGSSPKSAPAAVAAPEPEPRDPGSFSTRAWLRKEKGDLPGALSDYDAAIRMRPDFAPGYFYRAMVHEAMRNDRLMLADLEKALALIRSNPEWNPHLPAIHVSLANYHLRMGELERAIEDLTEVLRWVPNSDEALEARAECFFGLKRYAESARDLEEVLRLRPSSPPELRAMLDKLKALAQTDPTPPPAGK